MSFREQFKEFIEKNKISQNKAAEANGYTGSVISQYLSGNYKGDVEKVEATLMAWVESEKNRRARRAVPISETENMRRILNVIQIAHEERDIAVITGPAGVGKTTALRSYAAESEGHAVLIEVDDSMNKVTIIQELADRLGMDRKGSHTELVRRVCAALAARDVTVIADEADYLNDGALELLRRVVNDKGNSGLVLVGLQRLAFRIRNLKNDHQQLASRVGLYLEVGMLTNADAQRIVRGVWQDLDAETIWTFVRVADGSARALGKLIDRAHRTAVANNLSAPDSEAVIMAGNMIMKYERRMSA